MGGSGTGTTVVRLWFPALIAGSLALLLITIASYALVDTPSARILFWLGLGGEQNIGAWWSGMLLALAAFLTFDGYFDSTRSRGERRGWLALGFALLLLSLDEIASLHEFLSLLGFKYLAALGVVGLALASYGMERLYRARVAKRSFISLLVAFGLLASVPAHEYFQHALEWNNNLIYGLRAFFEEGTEIVAMLLFVSVGRANSAALWRSSRDFVAVFTRRRQLISVAAILLWPALVAATFVMPRSGAADWLAAVLFLACALLIARAAALQGAFDAPALLLILLYLAASAAANAASYRWDPAVFGTAVSLRGVAFAVLLLCIAGTLKASGRPVRPGRAVLVVGAIAASAIAWPGSQLLWCSLPPVLALALLGIESKAAAPAKAALPVDPLRVSAA